MTLVDLLTDRGVRRPLALGAMYWGSTVPETAAHAILDAAVDVGQGFVDTSNNYIFWGESGLGGESESCIGDWIDARGAGARERLVIATKLGARPVRPGAGLDETLGLGGDAIGPQLRDSLTRLRTDHVDLVYTHIDDTSVPIEETVGAMQQLVTDGLARAIGASNLTADRLEAALDAAGDRPGYAAIQDRGTFLPVSPTADLGPQVAIDDALFAAAGERVSVVGYSVLLSGAYTRADRDPGPDYAVPGADAALAELRTIADDSGVDAGQLVLAWMAQRSRPILPIVGMSRVEQLDSAVCALDTRLDAEVLDRLDRVRASITR